MCGGGSFFNEYLWSNPFVNPAAVVVPSLRENWSETVDKMDIPAFTKPIVNVGPEPISHNAFGMADAASTLAKGGSFDQAILESGDHDAMLGKPTYAVQEHAPSFAKKVGPYAASIGGSIASAMNPAFSPFIAAGTSAIGNQLAHPAEYYETRNTPKSSYWKDTRQIATKAAGTALALQGLAKLFGNVTASPEDLTSSADIISTAEEAGNIAGQEMEIGSDIAQGVGEMQSMPVNLDVSKALSYPVNGNEMTNWGNAVEQQQIIDEAYKASQNHPGVMYTIEGPSVSPYAEPDVNSLYENIRPAPANPGLDYPIADPKTGLPVYGNDLYDYTVNPETGEMEYSNIIENSSPAYDTRTVDELYNDPYNVLGDEQSIDWGDALKDLLKMLKGLKIGEDTEGTPGYIKSWFGGSGLDMPGDGYYPNRSKGRRDLGMNMLEGTDLDLDKIIGPYLEDYVYAGR